jgi:r-opsin
VPLVTISYCYFHILHVVLSAKKIQSSKEKNKTELRLAAIVMGIIGLVGLKAQYLSRLSK